MVDSAPLRLRLMVDSAPLRLRSISPDATAEEVAAIVAAIAAVRARAVPPEERDDTLHEWVRAARLRSHRSGLQRGPWRLSGRLSRRVRT